MADEAAKLAQEFRRKHVEGRIHDPAPILAAFDALPAEAQLDFLSRWATGEHWTWFRRVKLGDAPGPLLERFEAGTKRARCLDLVLEQGAKLFRPALRKDPDLNAAYLRVFSSVRGAAGAATTAVTSYEDFRRAWEAASKGKRAVVSRDGVLAHKDFSFEGETYANYDDLNAHRVTFDVFGPKRRAVAGELLVLAAHARGTEPTAKWLAEYEALAPRLAAQPMRELPARLDQDITGDHAFAERRIIVTHRAPTAARGLLWATARFVDDAFLDELVALIRKHAKLGDSSAVLAPYAVQAIALSAHPRAINALQHLARESTHKNLRKRLDAALAGVAARRGMSVRELEDASADTHSLDMKGQRAWSVGRLRVVLSLRDRGGPSLAVFDSTTRREVESPKADLSPMKEAQARLAKDVALQRHRLEEAMITRRRWDAADWDRTVARHPVVAHLARRLLWRAGKRLCFFGTGGVPAGELSIPHPAELTLDEMRRWQSRLVQERIVQPFKQLFRETYVVTDAERKLADRSNRFASHVVPHRQMYALLKQRGWTGFGGFGYDGAQEGHRDFSHAGLQAVMTRDVPDEPGRGLVTLESISFVRPREMANVPLDEVDSIVFSETMRDVDLVASVAGLGTDKYWQAWEKRRAAGAVAWHAERERYDGMHAVPAATRRRLLEELLPALGIAKQVRFDGSWAVVTGRKRAYRVHLGSGSVHVEPDGRYLCIVRGDPDPIAAALATDDDDQTAFVLSKIVLLARDDEITDSGILRQLR